MLTERYVVWDGEVLHANLSSPDPTDGLVLFVLREGYGAIQLRSLCGVIAQCVTARLSGTDGQTNSIRSTFVS